MYTVHRDDRNSTALIDTATGSETSRYVGYGRDIVGMAKRHAAFQEYVDTVRTNEKRVIMAGSTPICGIRRYHPEHDNRANMSLGARYESIGLAPQEDELVRRLSKNLMDRGIFSSGIDLAYPYVMEINILSPGGLIYHQNATGEDLSEYALT
ncbi:hypothetical protein [Streptomyces sp. PU-14G]|uniref:hypothetical protein n=1 Tax=Streptomyces sp. PU-14G TaxID=2800808 RepID=UPI0034DFDC9A